jgi:two-component system, NtrC family, response regulator HydG
MSGDAGWIAVVEDDPIMGESLQRALELEGWRATWWQTGKEAVERVQNCSPDLVLCDIRLPDMSGEEVFRTINARSSAPPFIFMTAFGQIDQAVSLVRAGGYDYLTKPFDLESLLQKAREIISLRPRDATNGILGVSAQMNHVEALLRRVAARSLPVLLTGETGSGKEVCARFLHQASPSARDPFMAVNCAAIPSELLESEVFGHERGAFSGAHQRHLGYAERARGGILFLDEIADMPLALQTKILRVLEERSFHRVGGETGIPLKARIVCATSSDLVEKVRLGRFREDLLYRINAVTVDIPPLRQRPEDISWLLSHYFAHFSRQEESALRGVSSMAEEAALSHPWRGNARELRNRLERAIALAVGPWLMPADIFPELKSAGSDRVDQPLPLAAVRDAAERRQIEHVLRETNGQIGEATKRLDISRSTLWEKMRRYGLTVN